MEFYGDTLKIITPHRPGPGHFARIKYGFIVGIYGIRRRGEYVSFFIRIRLAKAILLRCLCIVLKN